MGRPAARLARRAILATLLVAALLAAAAALLLRPPPGVRWERQRPAREGWVLDGISAGPLVGARLVFPWLHPLHPRLQGGRLVPPLPGRAPGTAPGGAPPPGRWLAAAAGLPLDLAVEGLEVPTAAPLPTVRLAGRVGRGRVDLHAPPGTPLRLSLTATPGGWLVEGGLDRLPAPLEGEAAFGADPAGLRLALDRARIAHPLLGPPVELPALSLEVDGWPIGEERPARIRAGPLALPAALECGEGACTLRVLLEGTPVADLLALLGDQVPEAASARLEGRLRGELRATLPGPRVDLDLRSLDLEVRGAVPDLARLARGPFTWRGAGPDGLPRTLRTGEGTPGWTPLDEVAPVLIEAVVAAEDVRFWEHPGYDVEAIRTALAEARRRGAPGRGGSTITQQLAKNLFLDGRRTLLRKLRELLLAAELDRALGKRRVMELYLNVVQWGTAVRGVRAAADHWFLKDPAALLPNEAALLAAILPAPATWEARAREGRLPTPAMARILRNMADAGFLAPAEAEAWAARPPVVVLGPTGGSGPAPPPPAPGGSGDRPGG